MGEAVKSSCSCELTIHSLFIKKHLWEKIKIEKKSLKDFENLCDWFDDNKLGIHFGDDKAKSFPFASKQNKLETTTEETNYLHQNFVGYSPVHWSSHILTTTWYPKKKLKSEKENTNCTKHICKVLSYVRQNAKHPKASLGWLTILPTSIDNN